MTRLSRVALHSMAHSFVELVKTVVHAMKQGKLEVVKQEMARVNVAILGISKLKWTGMGEFNKDDHYILPLWARIPYEKCSSHHSQQKSPKCSTCVQSQK